MKKIIFALIATASTISIAHAEGAYVGIGLVGNRYTFDVPGATSTDKNDGNKFSIGKVFGGYDLDNVWAIEGGYIKLGSPTYSYTDASGAAGQFDTSSHSFYGAVKGTIPVNEQFGLFGKLGAARNHAGLTGTGVAASFTEDSNKTNLYASLGGQYKVDKNVALTLEYEHLGKSNDFGSQPNLVTAGVRYTF